MKKNFTFKAIALFLSSLLLCGFTNDTNAAPQSEFDSEVQKLGSDLDENAVLGSDHVEVENQLSESEYQTIHEFIQIEETHIELDGKVYSAMPTNDAGLSIEEFKEKTGLEYQSDKTEYVSNYKALKFVSDNIEFMNDFAENGYGIIQDDGTLSIESDEFMQQSSVFLSLHLSWFKTTFCANYKGTILLGGFGLVINYDAIKDVNAFLRAGSATFEECFNDVALDMINEGESYFGNQLLDSMLDVVNTIVMIKKVLTCSTFIGRLTLILKYIFGHYAPNLLKGVAMILGGIFYQYGTDVEIGLWWSNYTILSLPIY